MREARRLPEEQNLADTANALQARAILPEHNVWVGASAGSGKTKVLTERVLRLLLPEGDRKGADPAKILCITFTKAAAAEVLERIMRYLRKWAIIPEPELLAELEKLFGQAPDKTQLEAARALFAKILDVPGGMKILTIHAFCQSVLARFPMEANLPPKFEVLDEAESKSLLTSIRHTLIETRTEAASFDYLASIKNAEDIEKLMGSLAAERGRLYALREHYGGTDALCAAVRSQLGVSDGETTEGLIADTMAKIPADALRAVMPLFEEGTRNLETHEKMARVLSTPENERAQLYGVYYSIFLTDKGPRVHYKQAKDSEAVQKLFAAEIDKLEKLDAKLRNIATADATIALLRFSLASLDAYETEKKRRNRLDYEDLIERTKTLLGHGGVHWVHYKLDGGIDHILVDEAQDTNPDQWAIITALYDEFYDGTSAREPTKRTTFVVGDEKQSIFSFQRADPAVFGTMRTRLEMRAEEAQQKFNNIPMRISFRSAPSILRAVDAVFAPPDMRKGVTDEDMHHSAFNSGKAGLVEIWPAITGTDKTARGAWAIPDAAQAAPSPVAALAEKLATTIRTMLDDPNAKLESQDRRIKAGDIMILLNKRKPLADAILKALRRHNIPVNGIDRMVVSKQLAVMDALCALAFTLQPDDDLNLATLLKSPFIGLDDEALFALGYKRTGTLWSSIRSNPSYAAVTNWLASLLDGGSSVSAYMHRLLFSPCPANSISGLKAIMSRLGEDVRDPLQELLARADAFDMSEAGGLQAFLEQARDDEGEIKRQMPEGGDCVRMMTVHGSKGLEAPIVFMPDTIRSTNTVSRTEPILWPDRSDAYAVPLWAPNSDNSADAYTARVSEARAKADDEYRRLLYVALTRAADRLYIGGADKYKKGKADRIYSWYDRCYSAFTDGRLTEVEALDDGTLRISNRQTDEIKPDKKHANIQARKIPLPAWAHKQAPQPELPPKPLAPSKPENDEPAALSPLFGDTSYRFRRGRLIHTLFQFLPDLPQADRVSRAREWLAQSAHALEAAEQSEILEAVMRVLDDTAFAPLFTANARAEVPLTGLLGPTSIVSGQIDRLLVTDTEVLVIDYKTNRPAPRHIRDVPEAYKAQMRTYRAVLSKIWPEHTIRCALLWTDGPDLMDITGVL
ncbi:MAG: double-strand break repair helicase AddA [Alphaproteobacteria bacterium]|nr:double-strand break repair helicase AddA [Alphaproteobacteria bacterium]